MITLPLSPLWVVDIVGSLLVIILAWGSFGVVRRLLSRDPENPQWLFLFWFTLALLAFALSRSVGHILRYLLVFSGQGAIWQQLRPISGGLNSITFVVIAAVSLFFYHSRLLYQRILASQHQLENTSREILELNREMEALVIERTLSEIALGVAHGIRNPLHIIGGFSHRLLKKTTPEDPARNWALAIADAAKCLETMVQKFENLAQKKESFFEQEDLNAVVRDIIEVLRPELSLKDLHLEAKLLPAPVFARLNKHLFKAALAHLLRNAIEATPSQGHISIRTWAEKSLAVLRLQDTGRGMPPEVVEEVFSPFYTTKLGGTGLGMVFVRQIVDEHRGLITLDSQVGRGTIVTIKLPFRSAESRAISAELPPSSE
jgi:signal transduction histidine kinase